MSYFKKRRGRPHCFIFYEARERGVIIIRTSHWPPQAVRPRPALSGQPSASTGHIAQKKSLTGHRGLVMSIGRPLARHEGIRREYTAVDRDAEVNQFVPVPETGLGKPWRGESDSTSGEHMCRASQRSDDSSPRNPLVRTVSVERDESGSPQELRGTSDLKRGAYGERAGWTGS